jgi:aminodeoxyfutalosine synthase
MIKKIKNKVLDGKHLTGEDALKLFTSDDIFSLGTLASYAAKKKNGNNAYFIRNRHINPTNICVNRCKFCAFSRSKGQKGAFELTIDQIINKLNIQFSAPGTFLSEVHIVGGLHPEWPFEYYLEIISTIKKNFPKLHIKAFTAVEIDYMSKISGLNLEKTLSSLKLNGLGSMPGGGAEIFASDIRNRLCPEKISGDRWLEIMETAHRSGIKTNATMLYGHIENYSHRVDHLLKLRKLQDKTGGFQAFIPLSYHPKNTRIRGRYTSGLDDLKTIAHSAGAFTGEHLTAEYLIYLIKKAGKIPVERNSFYKRVRHK